MNGVFLLIFIGAAVLIAVSIRSKARHNYTSNPARGSASTVYRVRGSRDGYSGRHMSFLEPVPATLGIEADHPAYPLVTRYERSWSAEYKERVKLRVQADHAAISDAEYAYRKLELDRFFILSAVLKEAPMFSEAVDQLWHEMLMFTAEYDRWSEQYIGTKLHHHPVLQKVSAPQLRAWFDWVYSQLFPPTPYTTHFWGAFFRKPMEPQQLKQVMEEAEDGSISKFFRADTRSMIPEVAQIIRYLKEQAKQQTAIAADYVHVPTLSELKAANRNSPASAPAYWRGTGDHRDRSYRSQVDTWIAASSMMFIASTLAYDDYENSVVGIMESADQEHIQASQGEYYEDKDKRSDGTYACSSSSSDHRDTSSCQSSDGGSSSCSSCSSCST